MPNFNIYDGYDRNGEKLRIGGGDTQKLRSYDQAKLHQNFQLLAFNKNNHFKSIHLAF